VAQNLTNSKGKEPSTFRQNALFFQHIKTFDRSTVGYNRTNIIGSRSSFVIAYIEMCVFRGNPFQAHSLQQSCDQKCKCKKSIPLIYLTFIHFTYKFGKHKQSFLSENYNRTRHTHTLATLASSIPLRSL